MTWATIYEKLKRNNEAVEAYSKGIEKNPHWPAAHLILGTLHVKMGQMEKARDEYRILKNLHPETAEQLRKLIAE